MNKKILKKIKSIQWEWEWGRKCAACFDYAIIKAWTSAPKKLASRVNNVLFLKSKDYHYSDVWVNVKDFEKWGKYAYKVSTKKGFVDFYKTSADRACKKVIKFLKLNPRRNIFEQYENYLKAYIGVLYFVAHIRIFNRIGEKKLKEFIQSKINDPRERIRVFSILSATTKRNAFNDFHKAMNRAHKAKKENNRKLLMQLINKIVENFKWVPVGYGEEPEWTKEDIIKQLKNYKPFKKSLANKQDVIKKLNPPEKILRLIDVIDLFVYYKDYLRRICNYSHYYSRPIFSQLGKKYNLNFAEIKSFMPDELGKNKPQKPKILFSDHKKIYSFDQINGIEDLLFSSRTKQIQGTVASPGRISGKVAIINNPDDLRKVRKNYILVSVMTSPDIMLAIKKAKAIITDEGGITCHAAIVSRELNIPCIIGTKIATKVLKDGDLVEVDANKGIVKKIN